MKNKKSDNLNKRIIVHKLCGKKHVDKGEFALFNHRKHLCHYCDRYFYDADSGVGI